MTSIVGTTLGSRAWAAAESQGGGGQTSGGGPGPDVYLWRQYVLRTGTEPRRVADFLEHAMVPALNRLGHKPIGVFEGVAGVTTPTMFTLTPLASLDAVGTLDARLEQDEEFTRAGSAYLDATAADPAFVRQEMSLLTAFDKFPHIVLPAATANKGPRLFELRTYESPSERAHRAKVRMFAEMGEIEIFRRVGLTPVFFSRTVVGPRMPSLVYMLVHDTLAAREKNWSAFGSDPEWRKLAATPGFTDPEIVSNITAVFLRPAAYSQI